MLLHNYDTTVLYVQEKNIHLKFIKPKAHEVAH